MKKIFVFILCLLAPHYSLSEGLAAQTLVATRAGYKKIENLTCDDLIVCYDRLRNNLTEEKVTWLHITKVHSYIQMVAGTDRLK